MVHRFVSRCQFGPGTSRSQMQKCAIWLGMLGVVPGAGWNDPAPRGVSSWWSCLEGRNWFGPRGAPCGAPPGAERVVCARWCPTLPHPGGCSTIGAVRLSFRVRDGSGRFPVAVTTETTTWAVRQCSCDSVIKLPATPTHACVVCVVGLGVDRIVDALRMLTRAHPPAFGFHLVVLGVLLFVLAY